MRAGPRRYKILHPVGKGAFGTVYRAQMIGEGGFHKDVAIKLMNIDVDAPDEVAQRQRDEARLLGLIRHRAILQVDGLVRLNGSWAVVMEYIDGINLRELLRFGPVPPSCALQMVGEVAGALKVAWEAQGNDGNPLHIIHRDIKPPNIQLTREGEVKLLDFGVARAEFDTRESETVGVILGTLRYMAPERLDGIDGPEGDVYALGVVLTELLTRKPMAKTSSSRKRHAETTEQALARVKEAIGDNHRELLRLISDCFAYDPDDRPTSKQVERRAWSLVQDYPLPRLQEWANMRVNEAQEHALNTLEADDLSGETLMEQSQSMMLEFGADTQSRSLRKGIDPAKGLIGMSIAGLLMLGTALILMLGVITYLVSTLQVSPPLLPIDRISIPDIDVGPNDYPLIYRERDGEVEIEKVPEVPRPRAAPVPKPAPEPVPPPRPVIEATPDPKPTETNSAGMGESAAGLVHVIGSTKGIEMRGARGTFQVPGEVPDGVYDVVFNGVETLKRVRVRRGGRVVLECQAGFGICKLK